MQMKTMKEDWVEFCNYIMQSLLVDMILVLFYLIHELQTTFTYQDKEAEIIHEQIENSSQ